MTAFGRERVSGFCESGNKTITVSGVSSSTATPVQRSYPSCTVKVTITGGGVGSVSTNGTAVTYVSGNGFNPNGQWNGLTMVINAVNYTIASCASTVACILTGSAGVQTAVGYSVANAPAAIYSDNSGTALANPFTADATGRYGFYVDNTVVDATLSGGGLPSPFTLGAISALDVRDKVVFGSGNTSIGVTTGLQTTNAIDFTVNTGGDYPLGRMRILSELATLPLPGLTLGSDLALLARGAADMHLETVANTTSSTTTVAAGLRTVVVGNTSNLYALAGITIAPHTANEEVISQGDWSIVDATHIQALFALGHTQPYDVRQQGAFFLDGHDLIVSGDSDYPWLRVRDKNINPYMYLPSDLGSTFPDNAVQITSQVAGANGTNKDLIYRNATNAGCFKLNNFANTATLYSFCDNAGAGIFYAAQPTVGVTYKATYDADVTRMTGQGSVGGMILYTGALVGTNGIVAFRNNLVDEVEGFRYTASTGTTKMSHIQPGSDTTAFAYNPRGTFSAVMPGALTAVGTLLSFTPDKPMVITRIEAESRVAPVACGVNANLQLAQGAAFYNKLIAAAANDSGAIAVNVSSGTAITVALTAAAAACGTTPVDLNVVVQYRMQ
jgi:hypothetical protein